ncbi:hypothetical protein L0Y49_03545 [bacterium]|nr:hypothetical protein [bacterium]
MIILRELSRRVGGLYAHEDSSKTMRRKWYMRTKSSSRGKRAFFNCMFFAGVIACASSIIFGAWHFDARPCIERTVSGVYCEGGL